MVGEVVPDEDVEQVVVAVEVGRGDGHQLAITTTWSRSMRPMASTSPASSVSSAATTSRWMSVSSRTTSLSDGPLTTCSHATLTVSRLGASGRRRRARPGGCARSSARGRRGRRVTGSSRSRRIVATVASTSEPSSSSSSGPS